MNQRQIDHDTVKRLDNKLRRAGSALILVVREPTPDDMVATLAEYDSAVMRTEISTGSMQTLQKALQSD